MTEPGTDDTTRAAESAAEKWLHEAAIDPVEAALASAITAIASQLANASPADVVTLTDRMAAFGRELEKRRAARELEHHGVTRADNVVPMSTARKDRGTR